MEDAYYVSTPTSTLSTVTYTLQKSPLGCWYVWRMVMIYTDLDLPGPRSADGSLLVSFEPHGGLDCAATCTKARDGDGSAAPSRSTPCPTEGWQRHITILELS